MSQPWSSMRASDADRDRVNEVLTTAFAQGRLRPEEYERRLDRVLHASTYGELEQVVTDLPGGPVFAKGPATYPLSSPSPPARGAPASHGPWGQAYPPHASSRRVNKRATHTLIAGMLGIITMGISAVIAVILGHKALRQIKRSGEDGYGRAVTGLVLGYFWTAIWALAWISTITSDF